ncbi:MAG: glycosyltransferase family 4 protein [Nitrososphaerales archaeon]
MEIRVPPAGYGGTEMMVSLLTEELIRQGHDVTLFASGDSITRAKLISVTKEYLRKTETLSVALPLLNAVTCMEMADLFDIIHNHAGIYGLLTAGFAKTPMLTTFHGPMEEETSIAFSHYKGWYNTISKSARCYFPPKPNFAGVVYNAIDCTEYPFNRGRRGDYLLYFSRFCKEKGAHLAIRAARQLRIPLVMAGDIYPTEMEYFRTQVKPFVDGKLIKYEGQVDNDRKKELMMNAKCLLAPIRWPEPFGLFMVESLACGTPVVAFTSGAAPEIVKHCVTGYVVESLEDMVKAVKTVDQIDSRKCRQSVLDNFDAPILAENYLKAYHRVLTQSSASAPELIIQNKAGLA